MPVWRGDTPEGDLPDWVETTLGATPAPPPRGPAPPVTAEPPPPPAPRRRWGRIALLVGLLALLFLPVGWLLQLPSGDRPSAEATTPSVVLTWGVGACAHQTGGPTAYPPFMSDFRIRQKFDSTRRYGLIACNDPAALVRLTAAGTKYIQLDGFDDDGCPPDTDYALRVSFSNGVDYQIWCGRVLRGAHPGDPGNGGGKIVVGDCVTVVSTSYQKHNDQIDELPCGGQYFATVVAVADNKDQCPGGTISRLPRAHPPGAVLCLGQGSGGTIAKIGECVDTPSNMFDLTVHRSCTENVVDRLVALSETEKGCPAPTSPYKATGYDRFLCLQNLYS